MIAERDESIDRAKQKVLAQVTSTSSLSIREVVQSLTTQDHLPKQMAEEAIRSLLEKGSLELDKHLRLTRSQPTLSSEIGGKL